MNQADLISPDYLRQQKTLHAAPRGYGGKGDKWAGTVLRLAIDRRCASVLDYGCGQGSLKRALALVAPALDVREYDPAIAGKDTLPQAADLVVCTDVIEHIEPARLATVLAHLRALTRTALFIVAATRPASKTLPDGRNAHLIVENADWWQDRYREAGFLYSGDVVSPSTKPSREYAVVLVAGGRA